MTHTVSTILKQSMRPFKIRIDWCDEERVYVDLCVMGQLAPTTLRTFKVGEDLNASITEAIEYSKRWFSQRGLKWWCNIDLHQREDHKHITLFCVGKKEGPSD